MVKPNIRKAGLAAGAVLSTENVPLVVLQDNVDVLADTKGFRGRKEHFKGFILVQPNSFSHSSGLKNRRPGR